MGIVAERSYPVVGGLVTGMISYLWLPHSYAYAVRRELLSDATSFGAIIIGFLAAAESVLATVVTSDIVQRLKRAGGFEPLVGYFSEGIYAAFALVGFSALLRLLPDGADAPLRALIGLWVGIVFWTSLALLRVIRLFGKILSRL